ncbi:MAG TPA: DUF542 domain-containing protein [Bacteroidia bacterium]|nr:DUF542 domain-containing protein [Bacteroidia bacterium]
MKSLKNQKVGEIVLQNPIAAGVFENLHIDYCCKGKLTLNEACILMALDPNRVEELILNNLSTTKTDYSIISNPDLSYIIDYIIEKHHSYVLKQMPVILEHLRIVVSKHGEKYFYLKLMERLFLELSIDLEQHLLKEEMTLFPYIKVLDLHSKKTADPTILHFLKQPVRMMMMEHEKAGSIMQELREVSFNYQLPDNACTTFRLLFNELAEFEKDLHEHVFLENNVLFPKAIEMEDELLSGQNLN